MSTEAATGLTFLPAGASQPDIIYAEMVRFIAGSGYRARAQDKDLNTPPAHTAGNVYIVGPAPTGAWASRAGQVAYSDGTSWWFFIPAEGWELPVLDENIDYRNDGSGGHAAWVVASSVADDSITNAKLANVATATLKGRVTSGTGDPEDLTGTQATTLLDEFTDALKGLVPASGGGTTNYLRADGTWAAPSGGGGGGTPGGADTQVQFNDSGAFGGDAGLTYNKTTDTLTGVNVTTTGLQLTAASTTSSSGFRLPHGAAPSSPTNGDTWTTTSGLYVQVNGSTVGPIGASATLANWTEAVNTSAPNATIPVVSFTVSNAATDVDASLVAKGNGATTAHIADNATTGGNKRGTQATDWQKRRTAATEVASGTYATISGGRGNTASNTGSAVGGGQGNLSSGLYSFVGAGLGGTCSGANAVLGGGNSCQATAQYSATVGGNGNISSAVGAFIGGGGSNAANGEYSWTSGGNNGTARSIYGVGFRASGAFAAQGDAQSRCALLRGSTTDATQKTLTTDAGAASTSNQLVLPNNSAFIVKGTINSRQNTTGDSSAWEFTAYIKRGASAAATAMVVACTPTLIGQDAGAAAWAVAVDADTTNGCLRIRFTGEAAKTIRTVCDVYSCCEVAG